MPNLGFGICSLIFFFFQIMGSYSSHELCLNLLFLIFFGLLVSIDILARHLYQII
jgi:hypothetical protein